LRFAGRAAFFGVFDALVMLLLGYRIVGLLEGGVCL
jgi:hypothetical protein